MNIIVDYMSRFDFLGRHADPFSKQYDLTLYSFIKIRCDYVIFQRIKVHDSRHYAFNYLSHIEHVCDLEGFMDILKTPCMAC